MKTITMYELLGMVKEGKAPKKIKYDDNIWSFEEIDYTNEYCYLFDDYIYRKYCITKILDEPIEIIEETPIISKLYINNELQYDLEEEKKIPEKLNLDKDELLKKVIITAQDYVIEGKINEIIDYLKSKGDE